MAGGVGTAGVLDGAFGGAALGTDAEGGTGSAAVGVVSRTGDSGVGA